MEDSITWLNFRKAFPLHHGDYVWKVRGRHDFDFIFIARFGPKFYGNDQPYPDFVKWNGWFGELPQGAVHWTERSEDQEELAKKESWRLLWVEKDGKKLNLAPCPFCKKAPQFRGIEGFIGAYPHHYWRWSVDCCDIINWPAIIFDTPKNLADYWNKKLS